MVSIRLFAAWYTPARFGETTGLENDHKNKVQELLTNKKFRLQFTDKFLKRKRCSR